jgi:predicted DNA-binding transcriptional regulator YafY
MREQIQAVRNNLIIQAWEENKNTMTMEELAEMFGITLQHAYRILKAEKTIKNINL